jgi:hypothetical protein
MQFNTKEPRWFGGVEIKIEGKTVALYGWKQKKLV